MKTGIFRTTAKRLALVLMMAAVLFAAVPVAGFEANAAAVKPGRVYTIRAKGITSETATISWSKAKGKVAGYVVFRNGKYLATLSAKTFSYKEKKLKYSTKYTYYVRSYNRTGKKIRQYYNKQTRKWQTKMPAKKYRGKSRVVNSVVFGAKSPIINFKTYGPDIICGRKVTPSMCPMSFIKDGTKCKKCGKGQKVNLTFKGGEYIITYSGTNRSKKCNHK